MLTPTLSLPTITQEVALNTIRFNRAFTEFENRISAFGHRMTNLGIATSLALSIPMQVIGGVMIKRFIDLDEAVTAAFSKIQGAGKGVKQALWEAADAMSRTTATSSVDLAGGLKELIASGYSARDAIAALGTVNKFAVAGEIDMAKASGTLISVMSALGLRTGETTKDMEEMYRISAVMVKAADATRVGVNEFAEALTHKALTAMKTVNMSLEEGVAILMAYAQRGIEGARAGEYLNIMLRDMQTIALKNADVWRAWGLEVYDATGKMKPVAEILSMLEKRFAGASDEQLRMSLTQLKFKDKSIAATLALLGASNEIQNFTNVLKGAGTILDDTYKTRMESLKNQFSITSNIIRSVGNDIVSVLTPSLIGLNIWVRQLAEGWFKMSDHQKKVIIGWFALAAVGGPLLIALGVIIRSVGVLGSVFFTVAGAIMRAVVAIVVFTVTNGYTLIASLAQTAVKLYNVVRIFGLYAGWLALLQVAHLRTAMSAAIAWLAELGPLALVIAAVDLLIYLLTGRDGVMWAFYGIQKAAEWAWNKIGELGQDAMERVGQSMDSMMSKIMDSMEGLMNSLEQVSNGLAQLRAVSISTMGAFGIATGVAAFGVNSAFAAMTQDPFASMQGFNLADYKKMMEDALGDSFDSSLLEGEDKKRKKQNQPREGYTGLQYGTAEEYKARVGGYDNQMVHLAQQQLAATVQTGKKQAEAVDILKRLEQQNGRAPRLKATSLF